MAKYFDMRAGDTEPLKLMIDATGLANLNGASAVVLFLREANSGVNHVNGASMVVDDPIRKVVSFDPVGNKNGGGNAFDTPGTYRGYVRCTFTDSDIVRFPGGEDLVVRVHPNLE